MRLAVNLESSFLLATKNFRIKFSHCKDCMVFLYHFIFPILIFIFPNNLNYSFSLANIHKSFVEADTHIATWWDWWTGLA